MVGLSVASDRPTWAPSKVSDPGRHMLVARATGTRARGGCPLGSLRGQLAQSDPRARSLIAALQGGLLLAQVQENTRPLETVLDTFLALTLANP